MEGYIGQELDPMRPHGGRPRNHAQRDGKWRFVVFNGVKQEKTGERWGELLKPSKFYQQWANLVWSEMCHDRKVLHGRVKSPKHVAWRIYRVKFDIKL